MTGRPLLVFFCLLGLAAPARAADAPASPPPRRRRRRPRTPGATPCWRGSRTPPTPTKPTASSPASTGSISIPAPTPAICCSAAPPRRSTAKTSRLAQQLLDALTALQPQWAEAWAARANADYLAGDPKATFADLARALADDPKHLKALADLGAMLEDAGRRDDALARLSSARSRSRRNGARSRGGRPTARGDRRRRPMNAP